MSTSALEKESLEAHVDLCALRYEQMDKRLTTVEEKLDDIAAQMTAGQNSLVKVIIGAAGTIVAGLLSTIVVILLQVA
jgi:tetrahydromethanopterin S-methyltransferase subunit G